MLNVSPLWRLADAYRRWPTGRRALVYRIGLALVVGLAVYVLVELAWDLFVAGGHCVSCPDPDVGTAGATLASGAAAAAGSQKDPPGSGGFGNAVKKWFDDLTDPQVQPPTVEALTPDEIEQAKKGLDLYQVPLGKGIMNYSEGSKGDFLQKAFDIFPSFDDLIPSPNDDDFGTVEGVSGDDGR